MLGFCWRSDIQTHGRTGGRTDLKHFLLIRMRLIVKTIVPIKSFRIKLYEIIGIIKLITSPWPSRYSVVTKETFTSKLDMKQWDMKKAPIAVTVTGNQTRWTSFLTWNKQTPVRTGGLTVWRCKKKIDTKTSYCFSLGSNLYRASLQSLTFWPLSNAALVRSPASGRVMVYGHEVGQVDFFRLHRFSPK